MKKQSRIGVLSTTLLIGLVVGCGGISGNHKPDANTPDLDVSKKVAEFNNEPANFFPSGGYGNGSPFNVEWSEKEAKIADGKLTLNIEKNVDDADYPFLGGEYRSYDFYGYGDYGVRMKPSKVGGTASTFFLYTGEWDSEEKHPSTGALDTKNPDNNEGVHDEIDIEFLGKNTNKVQFNYFTKGVGGHEFMYDLGFDASKEYHEYGFRWMEDKIIWFVDGVAVYQATENIPSHPGRIITNYWCGDFAGSMWMGGYSHKDENKGPEYEWFSATGEAKRTALENQDDGQGEDPAGDWSKVEASNLIVLANDDVYTVKTSDDSKSVEISYSEVKGQTYKNISLAIPEDKVASNAVCFEVENKGTEVVALRTDVNASTKHGDNNITAINTSASQDGLTIPTDLSWGGSVATIAPGAKATVEIKYEGTPSNVMFMIDSARNDSKSYAGNLVISNMKFMPSGEVVPTPTPNPDDKQDTIPEVVAPEAFDTPIATPIEGFDEVSLIDVKGLNDNYKLTKSNDSKAFEVAYSNIGGASYHNIEVAVPEDKALSQKVAFEVENKGSKAISFRADVDASSTHGSNNITCINKSATMNGETIETDLAWGGSSTTINAGAKVVIVVEFEGAAVDMKFFIDSSTYGSTDKNAGDVVVSNIRFAGQQDASETPDDKPVTTTDVSLSGEGYTCATSEGKTTITYDEINDNSYKNVVGDISSLVGENNKLTFKIKNNGQESVQFNIGLGSDASGDIVSQLLKVEGNQDWFDEGAKRAQINVGAGQERTVVLTWEGEGANKIIMFINSGYAQVTGTHTNGNLELSDFVFANDRPTNNTTTIDFSGSGYNCINANGISKITYESVTEGTYANVIADVSTLVGENNRLTLKIKNNGEDSVQFNIGIGSDASGDIVSQLISIDGNQDWFDDGSKRAQINVGAGQERTVVLTWEGEGANKMIMFINSGYASEPKTYTNGDIEISNIVFSVVD